MPTSEHVRGMRNPAWPWGTSGVRMVSAWMNARIGTCDLHALWCGRGVGTMPWPGTRDEVRRTPHPRGTHTHEP
jgi:hypothetical protein